MVKKTQYLAFSLPVIAAAQIVRIYYNTCNIFKKNNRKEIENHGI